MDWFWSWLPHMKITDPPELLRGYHDSFCLQNEWETTGELFVIFTISERYSWTGFFQTRSNW